MATESLQDLYILQLKDLYSAERQITKALPKMAKTASSSELRSAFLEHLQQTERQIERLEQIFERAGKSPRGKKCKGMEGLLKEGEELMQQDVDADVLDAGLIGAAQRVEHYEIASYGTLRTYARLLGNEEAADLLQQTLNEEGQTDKKLSLLAENSINIEATAGYKDTNLRPV